jgi:hypothetical protein
MAVGGLGHGSLLLNAAYFRCLPFSSGAEDVLEKVLLNK